MRMELPELSVSGITVFGTTPCFLTKLTNISHWPPSPRGCCSSQATTRSSTVRSAVSMTASRM